MLLRRLRPAYSLVKWNAVRLFFFSVFPASCTTRITTTTEYSGIGEIAKGISHSESMHLKAFTQSPHRMIVWCVELVFRTFPVMGLQVYMMCIPEIFIFQPHTTMSMRRVKKHEQVNNQISNCRQELEWKRVGGRERRRAWEREGKGNAAKGKRYALRRPKRTGRNTEKLVNSTASSGWRAKFWNREKWEKISNGT